METNSQNKNDQATQTTERSGFHTKVMPVLSKDGQFVYFFLGEMAITEHANRFKGLLGIECSPKTPGEKSKPTPRAGLHAKIDISLSKSKE